MSKSRAVLWMELDEWKTHTLSGSQPGGCLQKVETETTPKEVEGAPRTIRFVVSRNTVDRDNDTINQSGWNLASFLKNPVVPFAHDYRSLPVARAVDTGIFNGDLVSSSVFPTREVYPFADTVYQMITGGFLNAVSVGFRPKKHEFNKDRGGVDFLEQELLEYSVVPVPAHPEALIQARSAGIDTLPLKAWAEKTLDEWHERKGLWLPQEVVTDLFKDLKSFTITVDADVASEHKTEEVSSAEDDAATVASVEGPSESEPTTEASAESPVASVEEECPACDGDTELVDPVVATAPDEGEPVTEMPASDEVPEEAVVLELEEPEPFLDLVEKDEPLIPKVPGVPWGTVVVTEDRKTVSAGMTAPVLSEELQQLKKTLQKTGLLKPDVGKEPTQKLNPAVLQTPLPGSYEDTTRQLTQRAINFLTGSGEAFREEMDQVVMVGTFVDHAIFCVIGRDRPWEEDPCYRGDFVRLEGVGGVVQWSGTPTKIDIRVDTTIVSQTAERSWKYTEADEYAIEWDDTPTEKAVVVEEPELTSADVAESVERMFVGVGPRLAAVVQSATERAIRLQQGRLD